jgi:hypothetical protein
VCSNPAAPYLVGFAKVGSRAVVFKGNCDKWECDECSVKKQAQWTARAIIGCQKITSLGTTSRFVTVTTAEWYKNSAEAIAAFPRAWNKLYCRLKRKNPELMYLLTIEFGKKTGHMHAHFLTNATQNERWYKDNARSCGMGFQAKVEDINSDGKAAAYVSKYIGKSLGGHSLPPHFRRVRCSQNWAALAQLEAHEQSSEFDWVVCNSTTALWSCVEQCQQERRNMIDGATGEYFDYQDACDTWYA